MDGKAKYIFPVVMAFFMASFMSGLITAVNLRGFPPDFLWRWLMAFAIAWPFASLSAFLAVPIARRITGRIVAALDAR